LLDPAPLKINLLSLGAVLSLCAALISFGAPQANEARTDDLLEPGIKLVSEARFTEAVAAFNRFKQTAPQDPRPYFYSGMALAEAGRLGAAASELQEAVRLAPDRPEYCVFQAHVFVHLKHKAEAAKTLAILEKEDHAKQLAPAWLKLLADVYYRLEKFDDALRILDLWSRKNPGDPDLDLNRGQVYALRGQTDLALESLKRSIEKSAFNPGAYFELGKILYQRNELDISKQALLEAVRQNGTNPEYLYKLGVVCLTRGEAEEAIGYLKGAEPSGSDFPQIYNALGRAYQQKGDRAKGDEYLKKFQEITSAKQKEEDRNWAVERLIYQGEMQLDQRNTAGARTLFEQALQIDPNQWDAHGYLTEMFLSSGDLELARQHLVKMEEIDADSVVGNYLMATYWYRLSEFERARAYAEKIKSTRPGNSELRNLLGNIYVGLGQEEKALQEYEAAVRLAPDRADFRENLHRVANRKLRTNQNSQKQ
jgi:tetratricopeptide (TPR) repeat protein